MRELRITRQARGDLDDIQTRGLNEFGLVATRAFMQGFDRIFAQLHSYPLAGPARPEFGRAVRAIAHRPYRVLYRYKGGVISIMRVIHAARRPQTIDDTVQ